MQRRVLKIGPTPRIAVETCGSGPLVVFLHGIGGNRTAWSEQLPAVGEGHYAVAAWDARGYGDSDDYDGELKFEDFAADLARVMDALGVKCAHIVGCSMGGRIALDFYARWPERVATLTLADTSAGNSRVASSQEVEKFLAIRRQPLLAGRTPRDIAPEVAASLIGPDTDPQVHERVIDILSVLHAGSYVKTLDAVTRFSGFPAFELIRVPTLVLVGEHDRIATPEYAAAMARRIPGSRYAMIPGGSHVCNMDRAAEFNAVLLDFLDAHRYCADSPLKAGPDQHVEISERTPAPLRGS